MTPNESGLRGVTKGISYTTTVGAYTDQDTSTLTVLRTETHPPLYLLLIETTVYDTTHDPHPGVRE